LDENGHFAFLRPFGGLRATYTVHLRLVGKPVVKKAYLFVLIERLSLGVTAEALRPKID